MTEVRNKITGETYVSHVSLSKKKWWPMLLSENPEFFEGYDQGDFVFFPLD